MSEEKNGTVVETIEDSMLKVNFVFRDGYLTTIGLVAKSKEDIPSIDLDDKIAISRWMNNIKMGLMNFISNPPIETMEIGGKKEEQGVPSSSVCKRCGGTLMKKKACCGGKGSVFRCNKCGASYKMSENGRPGGPAPNPSPVTA